jgi:hypothetical protein
LRAHDAVGHDPGRPIRSRTVVARETELDRLRSFLTDAETQSLMLRGEPGIGVARGDDDRDGRPGACRARVPALLGRLDLRSGTRTLEWEIADGNWSAVVMNADGSAGVDVRASAGADAAFLRPLGLGLLGVAVAFSMLAAVLVVRIARNTPRPVRDGDTMTTIDSPTLRELDARTTDGIDVRLLWSPDDDTVLLQVDDGELGTRLVLPVPPDEASFAFRHPFAWAA